MAEQTFRVRSWVRGRDEDQRDGLVGYLSLLVGDLVVDNVTLRRTLEGEFRLSWPARTDRQGRKHPSVRPISDDVRRRIERQILGELAEREGIVLRAEGTDG